MAVRLRHHHMLSDLAQQQCGQTTHDYLKASHPGIALAVQVDEAEDMADKLSEMQGKASTVRQLL